MYSKLALSLSVSTLILVVGGFFAVLSRIQGLEEAGSNQNESRGMTALASREKTEPKSGP